MTVSFKNEKFLWEGKKKIKCTAGGQRSEALFRSMERYVPDVLR